MEPHVHTDEQRNEELRYSPEVDDFPDNHGISQRSASSIIDPNGTGTKDLHVALLTTTNVGSGPFQMQWPLRSANPLFAFPRAVVFAEVTTPISDGAKQVSELRPLSASTSPAVTLKQEIDADGREKVDGHTPSSANLEVMTQLEDLNIEEAID